MHAMLEPWLNYCRNHWCSRRAHDLTCHSLLYGPMCTSNALVEFGQESTLGRTLAPALFCVLETAEESFLMYVRHLLVLVVFKPRRLLHGEIGKKGWDMRSAPIIGPPSCNETKLLIFENRKNVKPCKAGASSTYKRNSKHPGRSLLPHIFPNISASTHVRALIASHCRFCVAATNKRSSH